MTKKLPKILAPAGDSESFLAAVAAGADAIYCGLKIFSARMEADNFSAEELSRLTALAHSKGIKVYIAFNSLIKDGEREKVARILDKIINFIPCDGLIIQDLAVLKLVKRSDFKGELHLSTLGNNSSPLGLEAAKRAGFDKVVLPRELNIDEIRMMASNTPSNIELEIFVHGALCYAVSGRCYWSSWFGGKSGLRGRCVQPCRRMYEQSRQKKRFFSCLDLSVDVLAKVLKDIPEVGTWKIEGRKKGPHYVFYTVKGYKMLRDHGSDPEKRKQAVAFLEYAMGRPSGHYNLLPQRIKNPLTHDSETGSGLFIGRIKSPRDAYVIAREALYSGDLLRVGYEDDKWHAIERVTRAIPKKGKFYFNKSIKGRVPKGTSVFIVDRREPAIQSLIDKLKSELGTIDKVKIRPIKKGLASKILKTKRKINKAFQKPVDINLKRIITKKDRFPGDQAIWLSSEEVEKFPAKMVKKIWWWLPPVVFPTEEQALHDAVKKAVKKGARRFILNSVFQQSLFKTIKGMDVWAGPFCNIANSEAIMLLKNWGFSGVIVSPELDKETYFSLPYNSPLPLGIVIHGNWPLCVSRIVSDDLKQDKLFTSPMSEGTWVSKTDNNFWVFPDWKLDLTQKKKDLKKAGYSLFVTMLEPVPKNVKMKNRQGLWNWNLKLL
ncbi:MAG: U32 family peptidase [Desulfobacteraceae bacterium]|nr:U32 family peptidase [Desulfobacteraceae bacterium]